MLIGKIKLLSFSTLITFILISCDFNTKKENYIFFKNGSKCDSTYVEIKDKIRTLYCLKDGTKSFVKINSENDTIMIKKYLNPSLLENIRYENNEVSKKSILLDINGFEHQLLEFIYEGGYISENKSFYFQFKEENDSLFFRLNPKNNEIANADSIWISNVVDYYPVFDQLSHIKYSFKYKNIDKWIFLPVDKLKNEQGAITILVFSISDKDEFVSSTRFLYIDDTIYEWCKENLKY